MKGHKVELNYWLSALRIYEVIFFSYIYIIVFKLNQKEKGYLFFTMLGDMDALGASSRRQKGLEKDNQGFA